MGLLRPGNGYDRMSDAKLIEKCYFIHQQVSTRTSIFATPTPTMTVLKDAIDDFQSAVNAALNRDRVLVSQKNVARQKTIDLMHQLNYYVMMVANGNRTIAVEAGVPITKEPTPAVITKPTGLKVENSDQEGELLISVKKVKGAVSYMHQHSTDPLLKEESWMSMTCSTTKCVISGLVPGTTYFIRVAAIGGKDQIKFSDVTSKKAS